MAQESIPHAAADPSQVIDLGSGANLCVVSQACNGMVLLEWRSFGALLPAGRWTTRGNGWLPAPAGR